MTGKQYIKNGKVFGKPKILLLIDKEGNTVRSAAVNCFIKVSLVKRKWSKLYGNNKAYMDSTYKLVNRA